MAPAYMIDSCNEFPRKEISKTTQDVVMPTILASELTEKFAAGCHLTYVVLFGGNTEEFALITVIEQ